LVALRVRVFPTVPVRLMVLPDSTCKAWFPVDVRLFVPATVMFAVVFPVTFKGRVLPLMLRSFKMTFPVAPLLMITLFPLVEVPVMVIGVPNGLAYVFEL